MSNRHLSRTLALQSLFVWDFNSKKLDNLEDLIKENFSNFAPRFNDDGFVRSLVLGVVKNLKALDDLIVENAKEWPIDQITVIDRNLLRLGLYELIYTEVPP